MTEFEINKAVADKIGVEDDYGTFTPLKKYSFDPCNNPADAMPIIIENGISMVRVNNTWSARQFNNHCIEINGDNYYRIAMEVYLLMNGK
ncbi:TPA: DUF2591 family protein [Proteus mirabilis]|nr:DUF2591 family protein [Proteus mirabilis]